MTSSALLDELWQELDRTQLRDDVYERYATGTQPLAWVSPESRKALGQRMPRMASNLCSLAVSSLTERLRIVGFSDSEAYRLFCASDLDQLASRAMYDALLYSRSFILVWSADGKAVASVEDPRMCAVLRDVATRVPTSGIKRWSTKTHTHAMVYLPDRVEHWVANAPNAGVAGMVLTEVIEHDLQMIPLVVIDNGRSEIDDLMPLVDALNKLLC